MIALIVSLLLSGAASAAAAPAAPKKAAATLGTVSGKIVKAEADGKGGKITITDDAGHLEQYFVGARTKTTCDGKKSSWTKAAPGDCDRIVKGRYEWATKRFASLELESALKADADDAKGRPAVTGEVAVTDVLARKLTVRLGGGGNIDFKVGDATKVLRETKDKPAVPVAFESLKVGDRVEVHSKDWKTADEIHVSPAN